MVQITHTGPLLASAESTRTNPARSRSSTPSSVNSSSSWSTTTASRASGGVGSRSARATSSAARFRPISIGSAAWSGASRSSSASRRASAPSFASSGSAPASVSACARPSNRSPAAALGRNTHQRHRPTPSTTPGWVIVGSTPARTSDDLPQPLMPKTSRKAEPRAAWDTSASLTSPTAWVRPKNTGACSKSNASRPRNGEPLCQVMAATPGSSARRSGRCSAISLRRCSSSRLSNSSGVSNVLKAALNESSALPNHCLMKVSSAFFCRRRPRIASSSLRPTTGSLVFR